MKTIVQLLKSKGVIGGLIMILFYQVVFSLIWMAGYSNMPNKVTDLHVTIVNEDGSHGAKLASNLEKNLPFKTDTAGSLKDAHEELQNRETQLIVTIPQHFTNDLQHPEKKAALEYYMNESNPSMISSTMSSVTKQVTEEIDKQVRTEILTGTFIGMNVPEDKAKAMSEQFSSKVVAQVETLNPVKAMAAQMSPMMLTVAGYVGAMIFSMESHGMVQKLGQKGNRRKLFFANKTLQLLTALTMPIIGVGIYAAFGYDFASSFAKTWLFNSAAMFAAMQFTELFIILFGKAGMILNIGLLITQTIANGFVIPEMLLPAFFQVIGHLSPMMYSIQGNMNLLFGGPSSGQLLGGLAVISLGAGLIGFAIYHFKNSRQNEPAAS